MDRNTYTPAARAALLELSKSAIKNDAGIAKSQSPDNSLQVYGEISMDSEDMADISAPNVFSLDTLGMRIKVKEDLCITEIPRSCQPNLCFNHCFGTSVLFNVNIAVRRNVKAGEQLTLPFNKGWIDSKAPLKCQFHYRGDCPLEMKRQAAMTAKQKNTDFSNPGTSRDTKP